MKKAKIITDNRVVPIKQVRPNTWNPKLPYDSNPEGIKNYARITKSMGRHGQIDPLLVREMDKGFEIIDGYHRYKAALDAGWEEIEIKNMGKIPDAVAQAICLAKEASKVPLDTIETAKLVVAMLGFDPQSIDDLPYDDEDAESMKKLLSFDWDGFQDDEKEGEELHDDSEGYKIILPSAKLEAWKELKTIKGAESDTELLVMMLEENMLVYGEEKANKEDKKAKRSGKK